jgi:zinc and cadmium transporter
MSPRKALVVNLLVSVSAVIGGIVACVAMGAAVGLLPYAIAFAGASLLYIAVADLIPGLHRHVDFKRSLQQLLLILLGIGTIWLTQPAAAAGLAGR